MRRRFRVLDAAALSSLRPSLHALPRRTPYEDEAILEVDIGVPQCQHLSKPQSAQRREYDQPRLRAPRGKVLDLSRVEKDRFAFLVARCPHVERAERPSWACTTSSSLALRRSSLWGARRPSLLAMIAIVAGVVVVAAIAADKAGALTPVPAKIVLGSALPASMALRWPQSDAAT